MLQPPTLAKSARNSAHASEALPSACKSLPFCLRALDLLVFYVGKWFCAYGGQRVKELTAPRLSNSYESLSLLSQERSIAAH